MGTGDVEVNIDSIDARSGYEFDGNDDFISIPDNDIWSPSIYPDSFSFCGWFLPKDSVGTGEVVTKGTGGGFEYALRFSGGTIVFVAFQTSGATFGTAEGGSFTVDEWTFVYCEVDNASGSLGISVNGGALTESTDLTGSMGNGSATLNFGERADGANAFLGAIAEVKIFENKLTSEEISILFGDGNVTRGLIGHWKLNGDATDEISGNDGTVSGAVSAISDAAILKSVQGDRVTANDQYMIAGISGGQIVTTIIEEAP